MKKVQQAAKAALVLLKEAGADKAQCVAAERVVQEFNVDGGKFSLYRTLFDESLSFQAIKEGKNGSISVNSLSEESIAGAVKGCMEGVEASTPDDAWDFCRDAAKREFCDGVLKPDLDLFFERLKELMDDIAKRYPLILMEQMIASHTAAKKAYANSYGVEYILQNGAYRLSLMYSGHEGEKSSSFFGTELTFSDLSRPLIELGSIAEDLESVEKQIHTETFPGKYEGVAVLAPSCLGEMFYYMLSNFTGSAAMIAGTSIWKDQLGEKVAHEGLTVSLNPGDPLVVCPERFTGDGFISKNYDVIQEGVLQSFMLPLYAANKTGKPRSGNSSFNICVKPGEKTLSELISGIGKGILVGRFSGGSPGINGEFSGVAKNSFLIEDGKITCALAETMINGNFADLVKNLYGVSSETVADGSSVLPYAAFSGVTISGK